MTADARRLLELLAASDDGAATDTLLPAHGFTVEQMVAVVKAGHATAKADRMFAAGKPVGITRVWITEAGRTALANGESET